METEITKKEQIEIDFAKLAVKKFNEYKKSLEESNTISDREFMHMKYAIQGCKIILQGIINEGDKFEVKLNK
jgi:hypothetical protein